MTIFLEIMIDDLMRFRCDVSAIATFFDRGERGDNKRAIATCHVDVRYRRIFFTEIPFHFPLRHTPIAPSKSYCAFKRTKI